MAFIADQLCSSACLFADAARITCFAAHGGFSQANAASWPKVARNCLSGPGDTVAHLATALPYIIRLVQCFRRHRDMRRACAAAVAAGGPTPANPHLYNAIKYMLSIGVVWASHSGYREVMRNPVLKSC
jgi:hypothetical protein